MAFARNTVFSVGEEYLSEMAGPISLKFSHELLRYICQVMIKIIQFLLICNFDFLSHSKVSIFHKKRLFLEAAIFSKIKFLTNSSLFSCIHL